MAKADVRDAFKTTAVGALATYGGISVLLLIRPDAPFSLTIPAGMSGAVLAAAGIATIVTTWRELCW